MATVVAMALVIALPPLMQGAAELRRAGRIQALEVLTTAPTEQALRAYEEALEQRSWLVRQARRHWAPAVDRVLRRGGGRVLPGRRNWLFYRDAVRYVAAPPFDSPRARRLLGLPAGDGPGPLAAIRGFHRQLTERGIELLVVPVPVKATLHPERLWPSAPAGALPNNPAFAGFLRALEEAGVSVVDPTAELLRLKQRGAPAFLPRDTHWTPEGMRFTAGAVVRRIEQLGLLAELAEERRAFDHRRVRFSGDGDLVKMLPYGPAGGLFRPLQLTLDQVIATRRHRSPTGGAEAPVLLLGDSLTGAFSDEDLGLGRRGGFAEHLADLLRLPVDVIAMPGGGASRARQTLALRPEGLAGKRLVIWQLTQRDLLFARDGWHLVELPAAGAPRSEQRPEPRRGAVTSRAELVAATPVPRSFDYAECLIVLRYRQLEGDVPTGEDGDFFALHWGWRDWRRAPAAGWQPGEEKRLQLVPIGERFDLESTCWADGVDMDEEPWWAIEAVE